MWEAHPRFQATKVASKSSFSMEGLSVLTAVLGILEIPLLFSFNYTHLYFHTLPQTMHNAALCHKPEALTSLAFWLFYSAWGITKILIIFCFLQKGIHIYSYLNYNSLMEKWTQRQTARRDRGKKSTGKIRRQKRIVIQLEEEVTDKVLLAHYISYE